MRLFLSSSSLVLLSAVALSNNGATADRHPRIGRLRSSNEVDQASTWWKSLGFAPFKERNQVITFQATADEVDGFFQAMEADLSMPTVSTMPSAAPSVSAGPSAAPSVSSMPSSAPSVSAMPSAPPSLSAMPSTSPTVASISPTPLRSRSPTISVQPSAFPSVEPVDPIDPPTKAPTFPPTLPPTFPLTLQPSAFPTFNPTDSPTFPLTDPGTIDGSESPTVSPAPSDSPTLEDCPLTPDQRIIAILAMLDQVADSELIRDLSTPQGQATNWLLNLDEEQLCPLDPKLLQRWALAVLYFSTEGDDWIECSADSNACFGGESNFLSDVNECEWGGITCNATTNCVTRIEFESNDLGGTIPSELALLTDLEFLGMEQGDTTGTIPTELGALSNLFFLDLDINQLTGTLPTEIFGLNLLRTLDLNQNFLTGTIGTDIGNLSSLTFLQIHTNLFTGTVPSEIGNFLGLDVFDLYLNDITGTMPEEICRLRQDFVLQRSFVADCGGQNPDIECSTADCCTACRTE